MLLVYYYNIKTKIKLSEGDFCIYKLSYEDNDKLIINIQARSEEPEKDIFSLVVSNDNNVVYQATSVNSVNHILDIINTKEFEICFKPVYEDIVNLDYEINTSYEIGEYKLIAQKQQFENVSKDLDVLQGLLNSTTSDILNLSNKKHTHTVKLNNSFYNIKIGVSIKIVLIFLISIFQMLIIYMVTKTNKKQYSYSDLRTNVFDSNTIY